MASYGGGGDRRSDEDIILLVIFANMKAPVFFLSFFFLVDRVEASGLFSIDLFFFYLSVFPMHRSFLNAFPTLFLIFNPGNSSIVVY